MEQVPQRKAFKIDGRYQLPPQLRRAGVSHWFRGYNAQPKDLPGQTTSYTYHLDLRRTVRVCADLITTWSSAAIVNHRGGVFWGDGMHETNYCCGRAQDHHAVC